MASTALKKALIFRLTVIIVDFAILSLVLGSWAFGGFISLFRHAIQTIVYWIHERIWGRVSWEVRGGAESRRRAIVKMLTFRLWASINDFLLILLLTSEAKTGLSGMAYIALVNSAIYYLIERLWSSRLTQSVATFDTAARRNRVTVSANVEE